MYWFARESVGSILFGRENMVGGPNLGAQPFLSGRDASRMGVWGSTQSCQSVLLVAVA